MYCSSLISIMLLLETKLLKWLFAFQSSKYTRFLFNFPIIISDYGPDQNLVERKLQDKHKCLYVSCKWSPSYPCLPLGSVLGRTECHLVRNADRVSSSHYYSPGFAIERSGLIRPRGNWQISDGQPKTNCQPDHIPIETFFFQNWI